MTYTETMNRYLWIIAALLLSLVFSVFLNVHFWNEIRQFEKGEKGIFPDLPMLTNEITSFEECAAAGYPIMESYPEKCATPDGKSFVRDISGDSVDSSRKE
jgi:hypothetical protein